MMIYKIIDEMWKKEYILILLETLSRSWPLAKGLKSLVESSVLGEQAIDVLVQIFTEVIKNIKDKGHKEKLEKSLDILEKIKLLELNSEKEDEKKIEELDSLLLEI